MTESPDASIYKVDKFVVPSEARDEFLLEVRRTHGLLEEQPGFVRDLILEQSGGPGRFNFVTMVEWRSEEAILDARGVVNDMHERHGFDPEELFERRGIEADIATYVRDDG